MAITVLTRPYARNWSGNPIHYKLYSAAAEADATIWFEINIRFKQVAESSFRDIITLPYKPVTGAAKIDIDGILDGLLEHEIPYLPTSTSLPSPHISNKATGKFYIRYREITTLDPDPTWTSDSANEFFVIKGGISFEKWRGDNFWSNYFTSQLPFLTWQVKNTLRTYAEKIWLSWLNTNDLYSGYIKMQRTLKFTDGSEDVVLLDCPVEKDNIGYFPAGADQLKLNEVDTSKTIYWWELQVMDTSVNPAEPLSEAFRFYLDNRPDENGVTLHYRNSLGGFDAVRVRGVIDISLQREFSQVEKIVLHDYFTGHYINGRVAADNSTELQVFKADIGHLGKEEQDRLRDLHLKREVWMEKQGKWLPVLLLTGTQRLKTSNDKRFTMTLEFCVASGGNYYYTPDGIDLQEASAPPSLTCTAVIGSLSYSYTSGIGWTVSWSLVSGTPGKYYVSTPAVSGGAPGETTGTSYLLPWLPAGSHIITVQPLCLIGGTWYYGAAETITITVAATCTPVAISGSPVYLPDAVEEVPYSYAINLAGTSPFSISNIVKPAWMTIALSGSTVEITGTPGAGSAGTGIEVSFDVSNCSGGSTASFSDTIDIAEPASNGSFTLTNAAASGMNYIKNVLPNSPAFYSLSSGTIPVMAGEEATGILTSGLTGTAITVMVIIADAGFVLQCYKNASLVQELDVPASGLYSFDSFDFLITDDIQIKLILG